MNKRTVDSEHRLEKESQIATCFKVKGKGFRRERQALSDSFISHLCRDLIRIVCIVWRFLAFASDGQESRGCLILTAFLTADAWASVPADSVSVLPSR